MDNNKEDESESKKSLEYTVVHAGTSEDLVDLVNDKLKEGWKLQGGAAAAYDGPHLQVGQAMTKKKG